MDQKSPVVKISELGYDELAGICDHTFLNRSEGYRESAKELKTSAVRMRADAFRKFLTDVGYNNPKPYAVCVRPEDVLNTSFYLSQHAPQIKIASVVGFPDGSLYSTRFKVAETEIAIDCGANEVDMVLNYDAVKNKGAGWGRDIGEVVEAAHNRGALVKVILETSELTAEQIEQACKTADTYEADFVKTSTGFGAHGARAVDVKIMRENFPRGIKISGGVKGSNVCDLLVAVSGRTDGYIGLNPMKIRIGESSLL